MKNKITWIFFYLFALLILILNGHIKKHHLHNFWIEFKNIIYKTSKSNEDGDYILVHKNDKK